MLEEERLQKLYEELADLIPEALAEDFLGAGYAKGKNYDEAPKRILAVEKFPGAGHQSVHCTGLQDGAGKNDMDFTEVVGSVAGQLLGTKGTQWQDLIAWSYLYKLAPRDGKPDDTIYKKQKSLCEEIIKAEIRVLKPTHVLFFTGWGSIWDFDLPLCSLLKGEAVEGWGMTPEGARLIVTRYAVRGSKQKFAADILEKIARLEEELQH